MERLGLGLVSRFLHMLSNINAVHWRKVRQERHLVLRCEDSGGPYQHLEHVPQPGESAEELIRLTCCD